MSDDWRSLNDWEASIIDRMLDVDFPGRNELRQQLEGCLVRQYDDHGCIEFRIVQDIVAPVELTVPVEASGYDQDGASLGVLLFVKGGRISELEIDRWDGGEVIALPDASHWEIQSLPVEG